MSAVLGIPRNPLSPNVPAALASACDARRIRHRVMDLPSLTLDVVPALRVSDRAGGIEVSHLAPSLLYWQPHAVHALAAMSRLGVARLNPVASTLTADDKGATALRLSAAGVPQLATRICPLSLEAVVAAARELGYPIVIKRAHGAQGRWVRPVHTAGGLESAFAELTAEGPGSLVVQPFVVESAGQSLRAIVTAGSVRAATLRTAASPDQPSNIAQGGTQRPVTLSPAEREMSVAAAAAIGLGHAGVDLLRTAEGPVVLEVNSYPDFTSMADHADVDLAGVVVEAAISR